MKSPDTNKKKMSLTERVKLQIDSRTIVIVRTKEQLKTWMSRHPAARIIT